MQRYEEAAEESDNFLNTQRYFSFPGYDEKIPLINRLESDPGMYSATRAEDGWFFHQNAQEFRRLDESKFDEDELEAPETIPLALQHLYSMPDYFKWGKGRESTVKWLVTGEENQRYVLKSTPLDHSLPGGPIVHAIPSLYVCSFVRNGKRIDIMPFRGETLSDFLNSRLGKAALLTLAEKEQIAEQLIDITTDLHRQGFIYTDIKSANICISEEAGVYRLCYIDDTSAIRVGQLSRALSGTVGYYAPEFFKDPNSRGLFDFLDWQQQCYDNRTLMQELKEDFTNQFSQSGDVYALGCIILNDLALPKASRFYDLARQMCASDSAQRPDLTTLDFTSKKQRMPGF